ncbi:MAG: leucyl aminopeptidase [Pirellula sp.]|jgi:leucyl aminopeptidase|nr:leucyl aminopeptidase [Pirellula sp.]
MIKTESFLSDWTSVACDALIVAVDEDWKNAEVVARLNQATNGWLAPILERGDVSTKPCRVTLLHGPPHIATPLVVLVGIGARGKSPTNTPSRAVASAIRSTMTRNRPIVRLVGFASSPIEERAVVASAVSSCMGQDLFRAEKSIFSPDCLQFADFQAQQVSMGDILGQSIQLTRRLVNLPPNYLYPESFASEAMEVAKSHQLEIEIWDQERLEKERCGALLGVARGSARPARLVILKYPGTTPNAAPIALVGKGVTFDSGGYSIKPTDGMLTMKADMAGAATVLGIMNAAAAMRVKRPLVGIMGLVENMISGDALKLGDVLTARSGKTIEIHNTDAEGRLVLADCLNVALDHGPEKIVDFATLTGACVVALGNDVAGLMSNHSNWQNEIRSMADVCGEYTWPLPMFPFFSEQIAGKVADIKNVGEGRWGGAITAAKFLEEFVGSTPWTHIDIAGPAFAETSKPWADAGGTGFMVRSMVELLLS